MDRTAIRTALKHGAAFALAALMSLALLPATVFAAPAPIPSVEPSGAGTASYTEEGGVLTYTATSESGWVFDHWVVEEGGTTVNVSSNPYTKSDINSIVKTAVFKQSAPAAPTPTVSPTGGGTATVSTAEGGRATYTAAAADGWEFVNWTAARDTESVSLDENPITLSTEGLTGMTANFKQKTPAATYKITVTDDGNGTAEASVTEAAAGATVKLTATPKDRSYEFDKWVSDEVTVENDSFVMPEKNVTVKATFKAKTEPVPVTTYTITFDANGGKGTMDKLTADASSTVSLTANAFKRDGYTFAGWNTAKDGSGTAYANKADVKVEGDMTLYAQWKKTSGKVAKTGDTAMLIVAGMIFTIVIGSTLLIARRKLQ